MSQRHPLDARTKFVLLTLLFFFGGVVNAWWGLGWQLASALTLALGLIYAWYSWRQRDGVLGRLLVFGLVVGFAELASDCWGIVYGGLRYFPGGPFIMCSPLYMPFAWALVLVQLGYLSYWFTQLWGPRMAAVVITLLGALNIPTYEYLAKASGQWVYDLPPMALGVVPYYVILAEALICLALPFLVTWLVKKSWWWVVLAGLLEGVWIFVAGYVSLHIIKLLFP